MEERHKRNRLEWAKVKVTWNTADWRQVVWSDKKKFNLYGPDGFAVYCNDLRQSEEVFSKRQQGGASLMVWGAFAGNKKSDLVIVEGNMNKEVYIDTLESALLPAVDEEMSDSWKFMRD